MYSQNDEELVITEFFGLAVPRRFIDIGAYDGKTFSNTFKLVELGWSGVCVEPSPTAFCALLKTHQDNRSVVLINAAIGTGDWLHFYDSGGDALSSSNIEHVTKWNQACGVKFTPFEIKSVSMAELFAKVGTAFDFLNLDVEALNFELFCQLPFDALKQTKVICVEHDGQSEKMIEIAKPYGFSMLGFNGENLILSRA